MGRDRAELMGESAVAMRDFIAYAVLFQERLARTAGLNATDLQALGVLINEGPASPGQLAERTGITRGGAITQLIDRLESAGFARRARDTGDRRRVVVTADTDAVTARLAPLYGPVTARWTAYLDGLTDEQLQVCVDLLRASVRINRELMRDDE